MRRLSVLLLGGFLAATLATAQAPPAPAQPAPAQPAPAQPAPAPPAQAPAPKAPDGKAPEYDPTAVVTIKGVVEDFHESKMRGDHPGLHLILKTETETVEVHACPVQFLSDLEFTIEKGDTLTVEGSRPDPTGVVVAREIVKGQTGLILRDKTGAPVWTR
jgi:nucleoid-associated protein YgaU